MHREKDLYVDWLDKDTGETGKYLFRKLKWDDRVPSPKNDDNIDMVVHDGDMDIISEVREYKDADKVPNPTPYDVIEVQSPWRGNILNIDLPDFRNEGIVRRVNFSSKGLNARVPFRCPSIRLLLVCTYYKNKPFMYSFYDLDNKIYLGRLSDFLIDKIRKEHSLEDTSHSARVYYSDYDIVSLQDFEVVPFVSYTQAEGSRYKIKDSLHSEDITAYYFVVRIKECCPHDKRYSLVRTMLVGGDDEFCKESEYIDSRSVSEVFWRKNWFNAFNYMSTGYEYCDTTRSGYAELLRLKGNAYFYSKYDKNFEKLSIYTITVFSKSTSNYWEFKLDTTRYLSNKTTLVVPLTSLCYTSELKTDAGVEVVTYRYGRKVKPMLVQGTSKNKKEDATDSGFIPDSWMLKPTEEQGTEDLPQIPASLTKSEEKEPPKPLGYYDDDFDREERVLDMLESAQPMEDDEVPEQEEVVVNTEQSQDTSQQEEAEQEVQQTEEPVQQELPTEVVSTQETQQNEEPVQQEPLTEVAPTEVAPTVAPTEVVTREVAPTVPLLDLPSETEVLPEEYQGTIEILDVSYIDILTFCYLNNVDFNEIRDLVRYKGRPIHTAVLEVICSTFKLDLNEISFSVERNELTLDAAVYREMNMDYVDKSGCKKGFIYNYITYRSVLHCCKVNNFNYDDVVAYKESHNCTYEEAVGAIDATLRNERLQEYLSSHKDELEEERVPKPEVQIPKGNNKNMLFFRGRYYDTLSDLCTDIGLDEYYCTMILNKKKRLKPVTVVKLFFNDKECKKFTYDGVDYTNLLDCCSKLGISASVVVMAYIKSKTPFEDTVGVLLNGMSSSPLPAKTVAKKRVQPEPNKQEPKSGNPVDFRNGAKPEVSDLVSQVKTVGVQVQKPVTSGVKPVTPEVKPNKSKPDVPDTKEVKVVLPIHPVRLDTLNAKIETYYDVVCPNAVTFRGIRYRDLNALCSALNVPIEVFEGYTSSEKLMEDRLAVFKEQERLKEVKAVSTFSDFNSFKRSTQTTYEDDYYHCGSQKFKSLRELCRNKGVPQNYIEKHLPELRGSRDFTSIVRKYKRGLYEKNDVIFEYRDQKYRSFEDACDVFYITMSEVREYRRKNKYATDQQVIDALRRD